MLCSLSCPCPCSCSLEPCQDQCQCSSLSPSTLSSHPRKPGTNADGTQTCCERRLQCSVRRPFHSLPFSSGGRARQASQLPTTGVLVSCREEHAAGQGRPLKLLLGARAFRKPGSEKVLVPAARGQRALLASSSLCAGGLHSCGAARGRWGSWGVGSFYLGTNRQNSPTGKSLSRRLGRVWLTSARPVFCSFSSLTSWFSLCRQSIHLSWYRPSIYSKPKATRPVKVQSYVPFYT